VYQRQHGVFHGYTSIRRPVKLIWSDVFPDITQAIAMERRIKGWSRKKKEALVRGDFTLLHELSECKNKTNYKHKPKSK
jgi:putative endonuclease